MITSLRTAAAAIFASATLLILTGCTKPTPEEQMAMGAGELQDGNHMHNDAESTMGTENLVEGTLDYLDEDDSK